MRLAALGLLHETNTFSPNPTGSDQFPQMPVGAEQSSILGSITGQQVWNVHAGAKTTMAGYHAADAMDGVDVVPLLFATAPPSGTITREAFEEISRQTLEALDASGPFDGVLMAQHGASVSEDYPDADAELIRRVRRAVGPRVPIGVVVDTHGNISPAQIAPATVTLAWLTNPHVDCRERALACADLVVRTVRGEIKPVQAIKNPPLALNILCEGTVADPMRTFLAAARELETEPGILSAASARASHTPMSRTWGWRLSRSRTVTRRGRCVARSGSPDLAWEMREQCDAKATFAGRRHLGGPRPGRPAAGRAARCGHNVGAGTPGDATVLLETLIRRSVPSFLVSIFDPAAVAETTTIGARVDLDVGGRTDDLHGRPVRIRGVIRAVGEDKWEDRRSSGGWVSFDGGLSTVVDLDGGGTVLLTSNAVPAAGAGQYAALGGDAAEHRIIVSKAVYSTRDGYPMAQRSSWSTRPDWPPPTSRAPPTTTDSCRCCPSNQRRRTTERRRPVPRSSTMRFAILGIFQETNTFSRVPADYGQFEASGILRGDEIVAEYGASLFTIAGYLQAADERGFEAVPLMYAATPRPDRSARSRRTPTTA